MCSVKRIAKHIQQRLFWGEVRSLPCRLFSHIQIREHTKVGEWDLKKFLWYILMDCLCCCKRHNRKFESIAKSGTFLCKWACKGNMSAKLTDALFMHSLVRIKYATKMAHGVRQVGKSV